MYRQNIKSFIFISLLICSFYSAAQTDERCATEPYNELLRKRGQVIEERQQFENWLERKIKEKRENQQFSIKSTEEETLIVPVVVHIVHNGETLGTELNIPDAQVFSQIAVLNKDFRRENLDANETPNDFLSVVGLLDIQFVLAKRDPEGLATNGIVRVQGNKSPWQFADDTELKSQSYWPAEDYLNIWVSDLAGNLAGYAQFPVSDEPGLEQSSQNRLTDGVVIDYRYFGSTDDGAFNVSSNFDKGRTTTHEIGHFFGLLHIWGTSTSCGSTDHVDDTPEQQGPSSGCPTHPRSTCGSVDMFQNYMDYTVDRCMNLFSQGQVQRMSAIIENSPRRESLFTSSGAMEPVLTTLDLGIRSIVSPVESNCPGALVPVIEIRNYGSTEISSASIAFRLNGILQETKNISLNLGNLEIELVEFNSILLPENSEHVFNFEVILVNNQADENHDNDVSSITINTNTEGTLPLFENFNVFPSTWQIVNPDGLYTWELVTAPKNTVDNSAIFLDFYNNENEGERDYLITPVFNFSDINTAFLNFDLAYARFGSGFNTDSLFVIVSTNCNFDFGGSEQSIVYRNGGANLATTANTTQYFVPSNADMWRRESIDLSAFIGEPRVQIAFVGINGYGNNLYLDDVFLVISEDEDIALTEIISPSVVSCNLSQEVKIVVRNNGTVPINNYKARLKVNSTEQEISFSNLNLLPTQQAEFILANINLNEGIHEMEVELFDPNGSEDVNPENNLLTKNFAISTAADRIPLRQTFTNGLLDWISISPEQALTWTISSGSGSNNRAFYNGNNSNVTHATAWLVSPVLDFSFSSKASVLFNATEGFSTELLQVWISQDCGQQFTRLNFHKLDSIRQSINLNAYTGQAAIRVAFVVVNNSSNNLFVDDIEFFTDDNPNPIKIESSFAIYPGGTDDDFKLTFKLEEKEPVLIQVFDATGREMYQQLTSDILNQTIGVSLPGKPSGLFIVRLRSASLNDAKKIYIIRDH